MWSQFPLNGILRLNTETEQKEVLVSSIRVIKPPPSDIAPLSITQEWVSVELPVVSDEELAANPLSGFRIGTENVGGYLVYRKKAIEALRAQGKHDAANYWERLPLGIYLQFKKDCCELIS